MDFNISSFLLSILSGMIAGVAILPIASDSIRGKLFGGKKRALLVAKNELYATLQEMTLNGQDIGDHTYKKLAENVSSKYGVATSALGDKDDYIAATLKAINLSKSLPQDLKKDISKHIHDQLEGKLVNQYHENLAPILTGDMLIEVTEEWRRDNGNIEVNAHELRRENVIVGYIVFLVGTLVAMVVYFFDFYIILPTIICVSCFLICINILISLIGTKEQKDMEFFRRLVYKIITLIVLMVVLIVTIAFSVVK